MKGCDSGCHTIHTELVLMGGEPRWTGCDGEASGRIKGMKWQCLGVKFRGMDSHGASNEGRKCVEELEELGWWIRSHHHFWSQFVPIFWPTYVQKWLLFLLRAAAASSVHHPKATGVQKLLCVNFFASEKQGKSHKWWARKIWNLDEHALENRALVS